MIRRFIYSILEIPFVYNLSQVILAPGAYKQLKKHFGVIFKDSRGKILDVGCGPKLTTPKPLNAKITGLDINSAYIKQFKAQEGCGGVVGSSEMAPFKTNAFDEARCFAVLHHLPSELALNTIKEMIRCTRVGGKVIVIDGVWPINPWLLPLAWLNRKLDRGQWMRHENELKEMVAKASSKEWQTKRFSYTYIGHEAVVLTLQK